MIFFFFYDGKISDKLFDLASVTILEATEPLPEYLPEEHILRLDAPNSIPVRGKFAFLRKEPCLPNYTKEDRRALLKNPSPRTVLCLNMQEALLGKVSSDLRFVAVNAAQKNLSFYFAYDGKISEEDQNLATAAIQEASISFPGYHTRVSNELMHPMSSPLMGTKEFTGDGSLLRNNEHFFAVRQVKTFTPNEEITLYACTHSHSIDQHSKRFIGRGCSQSTSRYCGYR